MMFRRELAAAIVKGEKTATRRPPSENPRAMWREERPWRYPVGQTFTINPGRGVGRVAEALVTRRYMQRLGQMEDADAKAEGFRAGEDPEGFLESATMAFARTWAEINDVYDPAQLVHVVEFTLAGPDCSACEGWRVRGEIVDGFPAPGSPKCGPCFGTGVEVTPAARALIAEVEGR